MKIEVGSTWVNKNYLDNTVTVDTVGAFAVTGHSDKDGLYMANINDFLHYFKPLPDSQHESLSELSEQEFENIIDEAFEEGYAQAYSELQTKTEGVSDLISDAESFGFREGYAQANRERELQEKAWDEGYDQAVYDLIDDGLDEEYSEYEFGDVEDDEEEYCFYKELDRILKSGQEQYEADPSVPSMGNRYDENGNLCGFFINTGNEKIGGIKGSERKHSHYFKDVRHLDYIDVYQVCKLFPVDDDSGAITHARKKLLVAGGRGAGKDMIKDITEARDTLNRYLQIEGIEE